MKILLYGPPGAGKDTVADELVRTLGIPVLSIGALIRNEVERQTPIGLQIAPYVLRGEIPPGNIGTFLLKERIGSEECVNGYILVGYPRSLEAIEKYLAFDRPTHVIHFTLNDDAARERLLNRGRSDDIEELIQKRLARYHDLEVPAVEYWRNVPAVQFLEINGDGSREEVLREVRSCL